MEDVMPVEDVGAASQPQDLPKSMATLRYRSADNPWNEETVFYILGTAHVSRSSCDDAARLIQEIRPDLVLLELCVQRQQILSLEEFKGPSLSETMTAIRTGRATPFQGMYSWFLSRVAADLDVVPGEEFRVALREARAVDAQVVLGDRPLDITLARVWWALTLWEKFKLTSSLLREGIWMLDTSKMKDEVERMKETDVLTAAIQELGQKIPSLIAPLLTERDMFMVHIMRQLASRARTVVAVVGAGHLPGIAAQWEEEIDVDTICALPPPRTGLRWGRIALLLAGGAVVAVAVGRLRSR